jgi:hypothetical protein
MFGELTLDARQFVTDRLEDLREIQDRRRRGGGGNRSRV